MSGRRWFLLRYDVESRDAAGMQGFLQQMVAAHRRDHLPVALFCTGGALEARENEFRAFRDDTEGDPLFEVGDHSYSHVGVGYAQGLPVETLRADYERSFDAHERILGRRPDSMTICGTSGKDGERLSGFDATPKAREELAMLVELGVRRLNAFLTGVEETEEFIDFSRLGYPDVTGFPRNFSDTAWLWRAGTSSDFLAPLRAEIDRRADANLPMPVVCHDWVTWNHAPDREFTHVRQLAEYARHRGFTPMTIGAAVRAFRTETNQPSPQTSL